MRLIYETSLGRLYQSDCLDMLRSIPSGSVHTFFADPPFNLRKEYGKNGSDNLTTAKYLEWSKTWLQEGVRILTPGGALFVYNLPKWLIEYGSFLNSIDGLTFKHWVSVDKAHSLPIPYRLSPSHYGLLYYVKGVKPRVFNRDAVRVPVQTCRHCGRDIKDYGGHKKYLNPKGLNLSDVWDDIPPVRHKKYKYRGANELSTIILERVLKLSTEEGDVVCDPFGGSGTTAYVAEALQRRWIVGDLNDCEPAKQRLLDLADGVDPKWKSSTKRFMEPGPKKPELPLFRGVKE